MNPGDMVISTVHARIFSRLILRGWTEENASLYTDGLLIVPQGAQDRRAAMEANVRRACADFDMMDRLVEVAAC